MSYFSPTKNDRNAKPAETAVPEVRAAAAPAARAEQREIVSTFGAGLTITGNVVSTGGIQVFGRVNGDIHAASLVIGKGADVEGNVRAQDVVIDGAFKGTIHGNSVKLQATANVDGEIYNKSLAIDQNAHFEGIARRLGEAVAAPTEEQLKSGAAAALVPEQPVATAYAVNNPVPNAPVNNDIPNGQAIGY